MTDHNPDVAYWTAQVNDLIGGYIVTNHPQPLSALNTKDRRIVIACECSSEGFARLIANLLNHADDGNVEGMGT